MIQPTVGKRLWFWPTRAKLPDEPYDLTNQPLAAFITCVNRDGTVNIAYFDRNGQPDSRITVRLWQRGDLLPKGDYCEYHPDDLVNGAKISTITSVLNEKEVIPSSEPSRPVLSLKKAESR